MEFNPIFYIDFYKVGHVDQYAKGISKIYVNFTPRSSRVDGAKGIIFAGLQMFLKDIFLDQFERNFFQKSWDEVEAEYREVISATLGVVNPRTDHIRALHELGHIPLDFYAVPEGTFVPLGVPAMVIVNNDDRFFWLPNYVETMLSNYIWPVCTSATTALDFRKILMTAARRAGETDFSFVGWQGHDFSYRGMMGLDAACLSGVGHLISFNGTDTLPAILAAKRYYNAGYCGGSVPATEHSVMCAGGKDGEFETFKRLITETYPTGILSIVSDTWDLWKVLTNFVPRLRDAILARDGKIVIRPDSGDPVKILTGDDESANYFELEGALRLLAKAVGYTITGGELRKLRNAGLIYGDAITKQRAYDSLDRAFEQQFSPYNIVFGIGSYTYQYVTRDTYNFAFKATAIEHNNHVVEAIFKDPITDSSHKKSHRGIPIAMKAHDASGEIYTLETTRPELLEVSGSMFQKVFNGNMLIDQNFAEIRERVRSQS